MNFVLNHVQRKYGWNLGQQQQNAQPQKPQNLQQINKQSINKLSQLQ